MKRIGFIMFLFFLFAFLLIGSNIVFAAAEDNIELETIDIEKIFQSLRQPLEDNWTISEGEQQGAITIIKNAIRVDLGKYLLFDVPYSMVKDVLTVSVKLARLLLGDPNAAGDIIGEIEKRSVDAAKDCAMDWLLQNEIREGNGNLELNYSGIDGKWHKVFFSYIIVKKPIDPDNSEVAIEINSPHTVKAPDITAGYQWEGGIEDIPPFILRVRGEVFKTDLGVYRWVKGPDVKVVFNEPVPYIEIKKQGLIETWTNKFTSWANSVRRAIEVVGGIFKDFGKASQEKAVSVWSDIGHFFTQVNPFVAQIGQEQIYFDLEKERTENEIEDVFSQNIESNNQKSENEYVDIHKRNDLDLEKTQDLIDDISEKIDILSQEIAKLDSKEQEFNGNKDEGGEEIISAAFHEEENKGQDGEEDIIVLIPAADSSYVKNNTGHAGGGGGSSSKKAPEISWCEVSGSPAQNKVIFSKIAWMGDEESANNEWFELKNITKETVDLKDWQIFDKDRQIKISFGSDVIVGAGIFYSMHRTEDYTGALNDDNEELYLFDDDCNLQDMVSANPDWPAGNKEERAFMERGNDLSWHDYGSVVDVSSGSDDDAGSLPDRILINEVAWMGTKSSSSDEWIELFNTSSEPVDLSGWQFVFTALTGESRVVPLENDTPSIGALSYFLMERTDDSVVSDIEADYIYTGSLNDRCDSLELLDKGGNLMDKIVCIEGEWPAGSKNNGRVSMERTDEGDWVSNNLIIHNGIDADGSKIWGTPKAENSISVSPTEIIEQLPFDEFDEITLPLISSPYIIKIDLQVPENKTFIIEPGVVNEFYNNSCGIDVSGTIKAEDAEFTSVAESRSYGGWKGIYFGPASVDSNLKNILLHYAGGDPAGTPCSDNMAGIRVEGSSVLIENSTIEKNKGRGLILINSNSVVDKARIIDNQACFAEPNYYGGFAIWIQGGSPIITNSLFKQNDVGIFIENNSLAAIESNIFEENKKPVWLYNGSPSFFENQADNNDINGIYVSGTLNQDSVWRQDLPYVISGSLAVAEGVTLSLDPGVAVDFYDNYSGLSISGTLKANGVEFSSFNKEMPVPGSWNKMYFGPNSINSELDNVNFIYGGGGFGTPCSPYMASILIDQSYISLTNISISNSQYNGIYLVDSNSVLNNVTVNNTSACTADTYSYGGFGINISGGNPVMDKLSFMNNANCNIFQDGACYDELPSLPEVPDILSVETPSNN